MAFITCNKMYSAMFNTCLKIDKIRKGKKKNSLF